jgi:L-aminopeptidase/D-esterase-like protein
MATHPSADPASSGNLTGSIVDVAGLEVGHHTLATRPTGCTVVICREGAVAGVDVRGGAPGTRETDLLAPDAMVDRVHAVLLSGGSAFGLDAAGGVMRWLDERGIGFRIAHVTVPIVPAAVLFDLMRGDHRIRPDAAAGYAACNAASTQPPAQGRVGAGAGAMVGKVFGFDRASPGGIGSASLRVDGVTVGALIAVNAVGDVIDPASGRVVAGARDDDGGFIDTQAAMLAGRSNLLRAATALRPGSAQNHGGAPAPGGATVIGVVATDAALSKAHAKRLAVMAHDGLARVIRPAHTPADGDTLFALSTGRNSAPPDLLLLGAMAAHAVAQAVLNAVR